MTHLRNTAFALLALALLADVAFADQKPLKVFVLVGQSNMEGHAHVRVLDYLGEDPKTAPLLAQMKNADGSHRMIKDAWISYLTGEQGRLDRENREVHGQLTVGYGNQGGRDYSQPGQKIGPELAFGITMQTALDEPILIIKMAWGGQSLFMNFRSPSSGPYVPTEADITRKKYETDEQKQELKQKTGARYRQMIDHVQTVLKDIKRVYPDYDAGQGYELAGFAWFQGFNDMVNRNVYPLVPSESKLPRFAKYSEWMANFIRDVRDDLDAPNVPFVIGVMGVGGNEPNEGNQAFREAMAAPAQMDEFKRNVLAVPTAPYWDEALAAIDKKRSELRGKGRALKTRNRRHENADGKMTPADIKKFLAEYEKKLFSKEELALEQRAKSNAGYHYLGSAKTYSLIGKALAEAVLRLQTQQNSK